MRHIRYGYQRKAYWVLTVLLLASMLTLAGCGPRIGEPVAPASDEELAVDVPMIHIDFDEEGQATLGGIDAAALGDALGQDLSSIAIDPETVQKLMDAGVQHVQLANRPEGMLIFINSKTAPALVWNAEGLAALVGVLEDLGQDIGEAGKLLPLLPQLGLNFALRFPVASGQSEIPMSFSQGAVDSLEETDLDAIAAAKAALDLQLNYNDDGTFELAGLNPLMMGMVQGQLAAANLEPDQMANITDMGIESIGLKTAPGGILISVNGTDLPFIKFTGEDELFDLLDLVTAMTGGEAGSLDMLKGPLQQVLPMLRQLGVALTVNFPAS